MGSAINSDPVRRLNNRGGINQDVICCNRSKKKNTHKLNHSFPAYINGYDVFSHNGVKARTGNISEQ